MSTCAPRNASPLERLAWRVGFNHGTEGRSIESAPEMLEKLRPYYCLGLAEGTEAATFAKHNHQPTPAILTP